MPPPILPVVIHAFIDARRRCRAAGMLRARSGEVVELSTRCRRVRAHCGKVVGVAILVTVSRAVL
jgi:hypothetical protein